MPAARRIPAPQGHESAPRYMGRFSQFIKSYPVKKRACSSKKAKNCEKPLKNRLKRV